MVKLWVALTCFLLPAMTLACNGTDRRQCQKEFRALIGYRIEAIQGAFGGMFGILPKEIQVEFVKSHDADYIRYAGNLAYDRERATLFVPRRILSTKTPNPVRAAAYYWPFYENEQYRQEFPVIEALDNVLWAAYLQEAAHAAGLAWPHRNCSSVDVEKRLPCEMLIAGIAEHVKSIRSPLFNSNRLDIIWPKDFADFGRRVWRTDQEYKDVQRFGGILLIRPLIDEFGVPRTLVYIAQTPFQVDDGNLQTSARRYQNEARATLKAQLDRRPPLTLAQSAVQNIENMEPSIRQDTRQDTHPPAEAGVHMKDDTADIPAERPRQQMREAKHHNAVAAAPAHTATSDAPTPRHGGRD